MLELRDTKLACYKVRIGCMCFKGNTHHSSIIVDGNVIMRHLYLALLK